MKVLKESHHCVCVNGELKADLRIWISLLKDFNGVSYWHEDIKIVSELQVHSNSTGFSDFRGIFGTLGCGIMAPQLLEVGMDHQSNFPIFFPKSNCH